MTTQPPITAQGQALKNAAVITSLKACDGWKWFQEDAAKTMEAIAADVLNTLPLEGDMTAIRLKIAAYRAIKKTIFTDLQQMADGASAIMAKVAGDDLPEDHVSILP